MRGKQPPTASELTLQRITPADAGKTLAVAFQLEIKRDHPRGCGENRESLNYATRDLGSPPRMRGKHGFGDVWVRIPRITPADAGKTFCPNGRSPPTGDHPRGCGENQRTRGGQQQRVGSPPRMRGKPLKSKFSAALTGITPADAGKTSPM